MVAKQLIFTYPIKVSRHSSDGEGVPVQQVVL